MTFPGFAISGRMFVLLAAACAWLHYSLVSSRLSQLRDLQAQEAALVDRTGASSTQREVDELRRSINDRLKLLTASPNATDLLAALARLTRERGVDPPVIRSGTPREVYGVHAIPLDIDLECSFGDLKAMLRDLGSVEQAWSLSRLRIDHDKQPDAQRLAVSLQVIAFAHDPKGGVP